MWSPTHVQITVCRARNLKVKGKLGTNDAYATIKIGKEKYQTSVKERSKNPEWDEQCDFPLLDKDSVVHLKVYHRNFIGSDDFLGYIGISLDQFRVYERTRSRWYALQNKPKTKAPEKYRGEIEIMVSFNVQSLIGSQMTLNRVGKGKTVNSFKGLGGKVSLKWPSKGSLRSNNKTDYTHKSILPMSYNIRPADESDSGRMSAADGESDCINDDPGVDLEEVNTEDDQPAPLPSSSLKKVKNKKLSQMNFLSHSTLAISSSSTTRGAMCTNPFLFEDSTTLDSEDTSSRSEVTRSEETVLMDCAMIMKSGAEFTTLSSEFTSSTVTSCPDIVSTDVTVSDPDVTTSTHNMPTMLTRTISDDFSTEQHKQNGSSAGWRAEDADSISGTMAAEMATESSDEDANGSLMETTHGISMDNPTRENHLTSLVVNQDLVQDSTDMSYTQLDDVTSSELTVSASSPSLKLHGSATGEDVMPEKRECGDGISIHAVVEKSIPAAVDPPVTARTDVELRPAANLTKKSKNDTSRHKIDSGSVDSSMVVSFDLHEVDNLMKLREGRILPSRYELSDSAATQFYNHTKEDLIQIIVDQKKTLQQKDAYIGDLQNYIDNLLVKVIEIQPKLLLTATDDTSETTNKVSNENSAVEQGACNRPSATTPKTSTPLPSQTMLGPYVKFSSEQGTTVTASKVTVVPATKQTKTSTAKKKKVPTATLR